MRTKIGVDLGGTKTEAVLLDFNGKELWKQRVPTPANNYRDIIQTIAILVEKADLVAAGLGSFTPSVGIGIPGAIDPINDCIKNANLTTLNGSSFHLDLAKLLGREIRFANDANCLVTSEATDGAAAGAAVVFGITLGTGSGGGIAFNGVAHTGPNAIGGEWGHNPLPSPRFWQDIGQDERPGHKCYCGKHGCIETWISGGGFAKDFAVVSGRTLRSEEIMAASQAGDEAAAAAWLRWDDRLARALASVINLLDPEVIVIGGGMSRLSRIYENLPKNLPAFVFSPQVTTRIVPALHGDASGVRGAAQLWQD